MSIHRKMELNTPILNSQYWLKLEKESSNSWSQDKFTGNIKYLFTFIFWILSNSTKPNEHIIRNEATKYTWRDWFIQALDGFSDWALDIENDYSFHKIIKDLPLVLKTQLVQLKSSSLFLIYLFLPPEVNKHKLWAVEKTTLPH